MFKKLYASIFFLYALFSVTAYGEGLDHGLSAMGNEFWISFPPNLSQLKESDNENITLYISSVYSTEARVRVPAKGYDYILEINPGKPETLVIPAHFAQPVINTGDTLDDPHRVFKGAGIYITSGMPVSVYAISYFSETAEGFLALPVHSLGKKYIISSYPDVSENYDEYKSLKSMAAIVGVSNNTRVNFTMGGTKNSRSGSLKPSDTMIRTLDKGDVWLISSTGDGSDLSGSIVEADKPVSVISANQAAEVPVGTLWLNYLIEMERPLETWGKEFLLDKFKEKGHFPAIRIYSSAGNSPISINGELTDTIHYSGGIKDYGYIEPDLSSYSDLNHLHISSETPINVVVYNTGALSSFNPEQAGGAGMSNLKPLSGLQNDAIFLRPDLEGAIGLQYHYLSVFSKNNPDGLKDTTLEIARYNNGKWNWFSLANSFWIEDISTIDLGSGSGSYTRYLLKIPYSGAFRIRSSFGFISSSYGYFHKNGYFFNSYEILKNNSSADSIAPLPIWEMDCKGNVNGTVTDMPDDGSSNLSLPVFFADSSENYHFSNDPVIGSETKSVNWSLTVKDYKKDARALIRFYDKAGNDTTISIVYYASKIAVEPAPINFGSLKKGDLIEKVITLINYGNSNYVLTQLKLKEKALGLRIDDKSIDYPVTIEPGGEFKFRLKFAAIRDSVLSDSLGIGDSCVFYFAEEINIRVGSPEIIADDLKYNDVTVNKHERKTAYIHNKGTADLYVYEFMGPFTDHFEVLPVSFTEAYPLRLKPGEKHPIEVIFKPGSESTIIDSLEFVTDAGRFSDPIMKLTGNGVAPGLVATSWDWGRKKIWRENFPAGPYKMDNIHQALKLFNSGSDTVKINGIEILSDNKGGAFLFDRTAFDDIILKPGDSLFVPISFQPRDLDYHELIFRYKDNFASKTKSELKGFGTVPRARAEIVNFGETLVGDPDDIIYKTIKITNQGTDEWEYAGELVFNGFESNGSISFNWNDFDGKSFKIDFENDSPPLIIMPGEEALIQAAFNAKKTGRLNEALHPLTDADNHIEIEIQGTGIKEKLAFQGVSLQACPKEKAYAACVIKNNGSKEVNFSGVKFDPPNQEFSFADPVIALNGFAIGPNETKMIDIIYRAGDPGLSNTNLVLTNSAGEDYYDKINISGLSTVQIADIALANANNPSVNNTYTSGLQLNSVSDLSEAEIKEIDFNIVYNPTLLEFREDLLTSGTATQGKFIIDNVEVDNIEGVANFRIISIAGSNIGSNAELAKISFDTYLPYDTLAGSFIGITAYTPDNNCTEINNYSKFHKIDLSCGDDLRKVNFSGHEYEMSVSPNPAGSGAVEINYSIAIDDFTNISVYNSKGILIESPVNKFVEAGKYRLSFSTEKLSSGIYWLRMNSGPYSETKKVFIIK
ncbi:MAG: T9SS type A sorting domain-containing protein [Candidatus Kapaibacterium sp.]